MSRQDTGNEMEIGVTTVEVGERRHLVKPYEESPVLELPRGAVACTFCGNPGFRRSRLRFSDLGELLLLRYPLRCTRCGQRQYNSLYVALLAYGGRKTGETRQDRGSDTWQSWTGGSGNGQSVARPMSTAIGPRAQRLETTRTSSANTPNDPPQS